MNVWYELSLGVKEQLFDESWFGMPSAAGAAPGTATGEGAGAGAEAGTASFWNNQNRFSTMRLRFSDFSGYSPVANAQARGIFSTLLAQERGIRGKFVEEQLARKGRSTSEILNKCLKTSDEDSPMYQGDLRTFDPDRDSEGAAAQVFAEAQFEFTQLSSRWHGRSDMPAYEFINHTWAEEGLFFNETSYFRPPNTLSVEALAVARAEAGAGAAPASARATGGAESERYGVEFLQYNIQEPILPTTCLYGYGDTRVTICPFLRDFKWV